jgi:hypothetical protein
VEKCVERWTYVILQVDVASHLVSRLHPSQPYTVKNVYNCLTNVEIEFDVCYKPVLWIKSIPLKVNVEVNKEQNSN